MRVSCHPPRPRGLFPLHQATFRRAPRIFLFRNHLPRALKRGWLKKSADRGRMRPDNGRSAFDAICLHPHSYSQANRFHGAILAVHRIRIDLTSARARTTEGAVDQSKIDAKPWKTRQFHRLPARCVNQPTGISHLYQSGPRMKGAKWRGRSHARVPRDPGGSTIGPRIQYRT